MNATPPSGEPALRAQLRRLARQARLLVAVEREAGVVCLPGVRTPSPAPETPPTTRVPPPVPAPASPPATAEAPARAEPAAAPDHATSGSPTSVSATSGSGAFVPRVRALAAQPDRLAPFADLPARVAACTSCDLARGRTMTVFGEGDPHARLVFCGEAPGYEEDRSGRPFVGRAGELLTAMIEKGMGLRREDVFILNTLKCRPPSNRTPTPEEHAACRPFLEEQLAAIRPDVVVALGNSACHALLGEAAGITRLRGRVFEMFGARVVPTYHPAYLLRRPEKKRDAWEDLKKVLRLLEDPEL